MYAFLDKIIARLCSDYNIEYYYHKHDPIEGLILYMRKRYEEQTKRLYIHFPEGRARGRVRADTIWEMDLDARVAAEKREQLRLDALKEQAREQRRNKILEYWPFVALTLMILGYILIEVLT